MSLEWDSKRNQKRCKHNLNDCRMLLHLSIKGGRTASSVLQAATRFHLFYLCNRLAFLYGPITWGKKTFPTSDEGIVMCRLALLSTAVTLYHLCSPDLKAKVEVGISRALPYYEHHTTDWVESCERELRSWKNRVAHQQCGFMLLCSKLCTTWKNMNENGQIAYNKLDLCSWMFCWSHPWLLATWKSE